MSKLGQGANIVTLINVVVSPFDVRAFVCLELHKDIKPN